MKAVLVASLLLLVACGTAGHREVYDPALCEAMGGQTTIGTTEYQSAHWRLVGPGGCLFK